MAHRSGVRGSSCSPTAQYSAMGSCLTSRPSAIRTSAPADLRRRPAVRTGGRRATRSKRPATRVLKCEFEGLVQVDYLTKTIHHGNPVASSCVGPDKLL